MKLSDTQRSILVSILTQDPSVADEHHYLDACVYPRQLAGLRRVGAVEQDEYGHLYVTEEARAEARA